MREDQDFSFCSTVEPHLITQAELNNLIWGLDLPKTKADLFGSKLQRWNILEKGVKVSFYGKRQWSIAKYFSMDGDLICCNDVCGIFVDPQVQHIFQDPDCKNKLNAAGRRAWSTFENIHSNVLGNKTKENYTEIVEELLSSYCALGCNMFLKSHFLQSHLEYFLGNMGAVSDIHSERFLQDISLMEKWWSSKWILNMVADYCWILVLETPTEDCKRQKMTKWVSDVTFIYF